MIQFRLVLKAIIILLAGVGRGPRLQRDVRLGHSATDTQERDRIGTCELESLSRRHPCKSCRRESGVRFRDGQSFWMRASRGPMPPVIFRAR